MSFHPKSTKSPLSNWVAGSLLQLGAAGDFTELDTAHRLRAAQTLQTSARGRLINPGGASLSGRAARAPDKAQNPLDSAEVVPARRQYLGVFRFFVANVDAG